MPKLLLTLLLSLSICLSSCTTGYVLDHYVLDDIHYKTVSEDDQMLAIGQIQSNQDKTGLLFFGEKYFYLVTKNGDQLLEIIKNIPAEKRLLTSQLPIVFIVNQKTNISGRLHFRYATPLKDIDTDTLKKIKDLGFTNTENIKEPQGSVEYMSAILSFEGDIYQSGTITNPVQTL